MSQGPFLSRARVLFSRHACPVNMTRSKQVSDTCPTVWCLTHRIRDTRGGLDVSGDLGYILMLTYSALFLMLKVKIIEVMVF
jgi:hypothetical protein